MKIIDLETKLNMKIYDILKHTNDYDRYIFLKQKYINNLSYDEDKKNYLYKILDEWEKIFLKTGEIDDEVIKRNQEREKNMRKFISGKSSFDRSFTVDGIEYKDEVFTILMLIIGKIMEEDTTLAFWNTNEELSNLGKLLPNGKATKIDGQGYITSHPDFCLIDKINHRQVFIEQKCVYKDDFQIKLRDNQVNIFNQYENIQILIKKETELYKDTYYLYNFYDIKKHMRQIINSKGKITYIINKEELDSLGIQPTIYEDVYKVA